MFGLGHKTAESTKKLSPKEEMAHGIEAIEGGMEMMFKLGPIYVKPFITVACNPEYPGKGKRFNAFQEGAKADGTPSGNRGKFYDTNSAKDIAGWILEREGHVYKG